MKRAKSALHRAQPQAALPILAQRNHRLVIARPRHGKALHDLAANLEQAATPSSHPQRTIARRQQRPDAFVVEQVVRTERREDSLAPCAQAAAIRSHPKRPLRILGQRHHDVVRETIARRERRQLARLHPIQSPAHRSHPEAALAILEQAAHGIIREPFLRRQRGELSIAQTAQSAVRRAGPDIAIARLAQGPDRFEQLTRLLAEHLHGAIAHRADVAIDSAEPQLPRTTRLRRQHAAEGTGIRARRPDQCPILPPDHEPIRRHQPKGIPAIHHRHGNCRAADRSHSGRVHELSITPAAQSRRGSRPNLSRSILCQRRHCVGRQALLLRQHLKGSVPEAYQATAIRPDPQRAIARREQRKHPCVRQGGGFSENPELHAIKPHQPVERADPQITVRRLLNRRHRVARQPIRGLPHINPILTRRLRCLD